MISSSLPNLPTITCPVHMIKCSYFCLQKSCKSLAFACQKCLNISEKHHGHSAKNIQHVIQETTHHVSQSSHKNNLDKLKELNNTTQKFKSQISQIFLSKLNAFSTQIDKAFKEEAQILSNQFQACKNQINDLKQKCQKGMISDSQIEYLANLLKSNYFEATVSNKLRTQRYNLFVYQIGTAFKDFSFILEDKFGFLNNKIDQILKLPVQEQSISRQSTWSDTLKGDRIVINGLMIKRVLDSGWFRGMALCKNTLSNYKKSSWKFRICCYSYLTIYLGIASRRIASRNKYCFQGRNSIKHGCYMIDTHGNTFSHHDKERNNLNQMNDFVGCGIILCIQFDPLKKILIFGVQNPKNPSSKLNGCHVSVTDDQEMDDFHIAAYLVGTGDTVELLQAQ